MQHKDLSEMRCPIARSLERVGEWWSILILRDAFQGLTRFDEFQKSLGIAPNMLTRRLNTLVESGLLARRLYSERPPRYEYILTPQGRDFRPVLWALVAWGNKYFAPEGESIVVVDAKTGERAEPVLVDGRSGRVLREPEFTAAAGPAADEQTRCRYAKLAKIRRDMEGSKAAEAAEAPGTAESSKVAKTANAAENSKATQTEKVTEITNLQTDSEPKSRPAKRKKAGTSS
jgi:DNA-binding HxlR family transcriptional regulator